MIIDTVDVAYLKSAKKLPILKDFFSAGRNSLSSLLSGDDSIKTSGEGRPDSGGASSYVDSTQYKGKIRVPDTQPFVSDVAAFALARAAPPRPGPARVRSKLIQDVGGKEGDSPGERERVESAVGILSTRLLDAACGTVVCWSGFCAVARAACRVRCAGNFPREFSAVCVCHLVWTNFGTFYHTREPAP